MMKLLFLSVFLLTSSIADACSFGRGGNHFLVEPRYGTEDIRPELPQISVSEIVRGHNDGNRASCSDAGIIILKVDNEPIGQLGFTFTIENGEFEDALFPEEVVSPLENGELRFVWLDGSSNYQEAFDINVRIHSINKQGIYSDPVYLQIIHNGGRSR